ncbi:hypothetical protein K435DRAFT_866912 [Dendrothele bispora CBS 962.96]|uniref:Uncharacterized protein n=1 Tax=Dendrothele bispora (strain CBS 962.96) TaxID=1314807 RepID=A0A4V4HDM4_DENBC|nr:hypothetical protein K435DRAFT_866912 [Dendrothele bispora CBS 962.96]
MLLPTVSTILPPLVSPSLLSLPSLSYPPPPPPTLIAYNPHPSILFLLIHSHFPNSRPPVFLVTSPNFPAIPGCSTFSTFVFILTLALALTASTDPFSIPSPVSISTWVEVIWTGPSSFASFPPSSSSAIDDVSQPL